MKALVALGLLDDSAKDFLAESAQPIAWVCEHYVGRRQKPLLTQSAEIRVGKGRGELIRQ